MGMQRMDVIGFSLVCNLAQSGEGQVSSKITRQMLLENQISYDNEFSLDWDSQCSFNT